MRRSRLVVVAPLNLHNKGSCGGLTKAKLLFPPDLGAVYPLSWAPRHRGTFRAALRDAARLELDVRGVVVRVQDGDEQRDVGLGQSPVSVLGYSC